MTNVPGQDREDAIVVMDDDEAFDQWMKDYKRKIVSSRGKASSGGSSAPPKRVPVSKDDFFKQMGTVKG